MHENAESKRCPHAVENKFPELDRGFLMQMIEQESVPPAPLAVAADRELPRLDEKLYIGLSSTVARENAHP